MNAVYRGLSCYLLTLGQQLAASLDLIATSISNIFNISEYTLTTGSFNNLSMLNIYMLKVKQPYITKVQT